MNIYTQKLYTHTHTHIVCFVSQDSYCETERYKYEKSKGKKYPQRIGLDWRYQYKQIISEIYVISSLC